MHYLLKEFVVGNDTLLVMDILANFYDIQQYEHLSHLYVIQNLLELGWIKQTQLHPLNLNDRSKLEFLNITVSLSNIFFQQLEGKYPQFELPQKEPYSDQLQYLHNQFSKIELLQQFHTIKQNFDPISTRYKTIYNQIQQLEERITDRVSLTSDTIILEKIFDEYHLSYEEKIIFLFILKEEYSGRDETTRDMNRLIELISSNDYEKIKYRSLFEEGSTLLSNNLIDYDEMLTPFGAINRNFYIPDDILYKISHTKKKKNRSHKIKMESIIKDQTLFELIHSQKSLDDIVLHPKTEKVLKTLLQQTDRHVIHRLKSWGIQDRRKGIDARIIFYGSAGTGKTVTALALARSLKKEVLSFDCSKILSMYIGESEKNVRNIFDTYKDLCDKTRSEPILLLNEADQFLSSRTQNVNSSSDKMHNQMQNIFLEQIEKFQGILIATTNLLENIDAAFSRRFNYKLEFTKPSVEQRKSLWQKLLPKSLPLSKDFSLNKLLEYELTGGQIELIIRNTAFNMAINPDPIFTTEDFIEEINKELNSMFDGSQRVGFC